QDRTGREHARVSTLQLDRTRRVDVHLSGGYPDSAALFGGGAAGDRAGRHADHGRRRAAAGRPRREGGNDARQGPHAWLLPADRRDQAEAPNGARDHRRAFRNPLLGTPGPRHRSRPVRLDGEEEAGGLLLMARLSVVETKPQTAAQRVAARIAAEDRGLLRFLTCGGVDDGKSTLIGRLLYDSSLIYEDQMRSVEHDSRRSGAARGGTLDLSLLIDGLQAEREQKITIDVAYRYFSTPRRKFIVADTPGHVQYTRNMATGASNCDFAVLLVDARSGVLTQTRRHSCILSLLGINKVALAVNKMDLVDFDQARFEAIAEEFANFAAPLGFEHITAIPVSASKGDNVISPSAHMHWYHGPTLLGHLETVDI